MLKSKTQREMVEAGGRLFHLLNLPRKTGQIYGLLFLSVRPLVLDDMCELLSISKGSASMGTRQLMRWGAIRQFWIEGDRRDHFEVIADFSEVIRTAYRDFIKPRLSSSTKRIQSINASLDEELQEGSLTKEEYELLRERIGNITKLQRKLSTLMPLAENFI